MFNLQIPALLRSVPDTEILGVNIQQRRASFHCYVPSFACCRDALVKAPTGSGKTLAYLAPIVHDLQVRPAGGFKNVIGGACCSTC